MLNDIYNLVRKHYIRTVLIIVLATTGGYTIFGLVFPFQREIVYEMHTVFATCPPSMAGNCVARVELVIGNTGHAEESVSLAWPDYQGNWTRGERVLNISADRRRARDPFVSCAVVPGQQECIIRQFSPGALVIMHLDCYQCSRQQVQLLAETPLVIQTEAHTAYGDPRVAVLLRRLLALAHLF